MLETERVCQQGTEAWRRLKREKSWGDWLVVGAALQIGRQWAMNQAGTNRPMGKGYNMAFAEWLHRYKLDDMDKGDRSRLFEIMDNLSPIEQWRQTLTMTQRLALNHPNSVMRKWKKAVEPEPNEDKTGEPKKTTRDELALALEENHRLQQHIAELEAARDACPVCGAKAA